MGVYIGMGRSIGGYGGSVGLHGGCGVFMGVYQWLWEFYKGL